MLHAVRDKAVNPRSKAPEMERNALEARASRDCRWRLEPPGQRVPRLEPRNKDIPLGNGEKVADRPDEGADME